MFSFIIFFAIALAIGFLMEGWLRKKLKIEKSKGFIYKGVNKFQRIVETTMLIAFLIALWFVEKVSLLLITFFIIQYSFRAIMEWKYEKEKREYILTLYGLFMFLVLIGIAVYFDMI